ncbi:GNAT family N-acetyltransferase [Clostridium botulinum]|uniref:GNAT family N-acetyltransferase n=1 Tax=Clostridium botulinum TaxID=1491 RepID=UPI0007E25F1E|nr:GNAT family N-acetyltransferase [Clostridium botulinum]KEI76324.1 GNAT family acetyltransferase [Clostridium botulinum B2 128]MCR1163790.1 GNAT family N-acetyltransferase [Clostridium botulinum]NFI43849.1 GNAT family N-acetyltransferase [Clostridium botulinum]NFI76243.1 GNAT family N-acetyltransferase [Clostridium botulinum]NFI84475.1 GNAT family N-acetyltransferase [Clostridium botulinum]
MEWKLKKFKELSVEEMYEILRVRNQVFIVEQECPYQDIDYKDKNAYHLFAHDNGIIIAYLRILEKGISYDEISIGRVLINKDYRGKGLARKLMLKAIEFIENNMNENEIKISAQAYLLDFYRSLGFNEVSEVYLEDNIPHIDMLHKKNISI